MLKLLGRDEARGLREFFASANYTATQLNDCMNLGRLPSRLQRTLPHMFDQTREPTALNILTRWFYIGVPVSGRLARETLPEWLLSAMLESGLLSSEAQQLIPRVRITPVGKLLIAADCALDYETQKPADLVLWPNRTTRLLSLFTVRKPSRRTLDLGAGCGSQSLEAAAHSDTVVAADISARAIEFAAFNARLNAVDNVEFVTGDMFAPVEGQKFDLIVSNPPFFITPSNNFVFCDNNLDLDQFCARLVRDVPRYLNEDGYFRCCANGPKWKASPGRTGWRDGLRTR